MPDAVETGERARVSAAEASWALRDVVRADAEAQRSLSRRLALRPLDYAALDLVMKHEGEEGLGPAELARLLEISTGSTTELLDRLERSGHLYRDRHPTDRRRLVLRATDTAVASTLGHLAPLLTSLDALAGTLTPEERVVVTAYLRSAAHHLRRYARPGTPRP